MEQNPNTKVDINEKINDMIIDFIYDLVDSCFKQGRFEDINSMLQKINITSSSTDLLLAFLTATLPAKSKLPNRKKFFEDAVEETKKRSEYEDNLFFGLE